jgi:hypothetical protein
VDNLDAEGACQIPKLGWQFEGTVKERKKVCMAETSSGRESMSLFLLLYVILVLRGSLLFHVKQLNQFIMAKHSCTIKYLWPGISHLRRGEVAI